MIWYLLHNHLAGIIEQRCIVAYLDSFPLARDLRQARLASHKGVILLFQTQEELRPFFGSPSGVVTKYS